MWIPAWIKNTVLHTWEPIRQPTKAVKLLLLQMNAVGQVDSHLRMKCQWMTTMANEGHVLVNKYYRIGFYKQSLPLWLHDDAENRCTVPDRSSKEPL